MSYDLPLSKSSLVVSIPALDDCPDCAYKFTDMSYWQAGSQTFFEYLPPAVTVLKALIRARMKMFQNLRSNGDKDDHRYFIKLIIDIQLQYSSSSIVFNHLFTFLLLV